MTLLPYTGANARSFCATENSQPVHMLRQRVSRLVGEALSFSKKLANHIGAIKLFICHYNLTKAPALHGGSCWIPGSYTPCTGLKPLILNGFFQRYHIGHDRRVKPLKTICYTKLDQLRPWNPI